MELLYTKCGISVLKDGPLQIIKFDNPSSKNAISHEAYDVITKALREGSEDEEIVVTVLTGEGSYYSSGFNIAQAAKPDVDFNEDLIHYNTLKLREFIDALIDYPKLLIAVVNGPAFGIAVTTLALCDIVYASDKAVFRTPFTRLGLCAEGCSSYTFPLILGTSRASDMLFLGAELSAEEAHQRGFVAEVYRTGDGDRIWERIKQHSTLPAASLQATKRLVRRFNRDNLHRANYYETQELITRFTSDEFMASVMAFLTKKRKSKL